MFWRIPHQRLGFSDEEWETMPSGHRRIVKSYVLNGYDREQTSLYEEYETVFQVRKVEKWYGLEQRPKIQLSVDDFCLV